MKIPASTNANTIGLAAGIGKSAGISLSAVLAVICAVCLVLPSGAALDCAGELKNGKDALSKRYGKLAREIYGRLLKNCPANADIEYGMGMALKLDGKASESERYFRRALKLNPSHAEALTELGEILTWNDATRPEGIEMLRRAVLASRTHGKAEKLLGLTLSWGEPTRAEAESLLIQYTKEHPEDTDALLALARTQNWLGKRSEAEASYRAVLDRTQDNPSYEVLYELALLVSYDTNRRDSALDILTRAMAAKPSEAQAQYAYYMVQAWTGRYREAIKGLSELRQQYPSLVWAQGTGADKDMPVELALAKVLSWAREYKQSETLLKEILAARPGYMPAERELGMILSYQHDRREEALPLLTRVLAAHPDDDEAALALAQTHIAMKHFELAEPILSRVMARNTELPLAHKIHGNLLSAQKLSEQAIRAYEKARSLGLFDADTAHGLANAHLACGNASESERAAREGLAHGAQDARLQLVLAKSLIQQKRTDEALALLRQLMQTDQLLELAKISEEFAGPEETRDFAIELCRKTLAQDPDNEHCLKNLGRVLSWSERTRPEALSLLARYAQKYPKDIEARRYFAEVTSWTGKLKEALSMYDELLRVAPDNNDVKASRAQVLSWMGKLPRAIKEYRAVLASNPRHKDALVGLGQVLNWRGDNFKAEQVFQTAIESYPDAPDVVLERALNFQRMGRKDLALQGAQRVIQIFEVL